MENRDTIQEDYNVLDSKVWFSNQPRSTWLAVADIPAAILWSVWGYIDTNRCVYLENSSYLIGRGEIRFE